MTKQPEEIEGVLLFGEHEPVLIGHMKIGRAHYQIAGIRKSPTRFNFTAVRDERQGDLFDRGDDK